MALQIGDTAPDFHAQTTEGEIDFHDWIGDSWAVLFSHPKDFTPVCTTELGYMAKIKPEFDKRNVKIIGLSVDPTGKHEEWAKDIEETQGTAPNYPIIGDSDFQVSKLYGMLANDVSGDAADRTPADNQTVRNVFVIGPDKKVKLILVYPMTTGRNFDEVIRVIDSLQLTAKHKVSTPVNWQQGEDVIIAGSVSNDEAKELFGEWQEPKPYIRIVPQPAVAAVHSTLRGRASSPSPRSPVGQRRAQPCDRGREAPAARRGPPRPDDHGGLVGLDRLDVLDRDEQRPAEPSTSDLEHVRPIRARSVDDSSTTPSSPLARVDVEALAAVELVVALARLGRPAELDHRQLRGFRPRDIRPVEAAQHSKLRLQGGDLCRQLRQLPLELGHRLRASDPEQPREPLRALRVLAQPRPALRHLLVLGARPSHRGYLHACCDCRTR